MTLRTVDMNKECHGFGERLGYVYNGLSSVIENEEVAQVLFLMYMDSVLDRLEDQIEPQDKSQDKSQDKPLFNTNSKAFLDEWYKYLDDL